MNIKIVTGLWHNPFAEQYIVYSKTLTWYDLAPSRLLMTWYRPNQHGLLWTTETVATNSLIPKWTDYTM